MVAVEQRLRARLLEAHGPVERRDLLPTPREACRLLHSYRFHDEHLFVAQRRETLRGFVVELSRCVSSMLS
jgi:hypothetical protein